MAEYKNKILIIGSGPAGYSAGIYSARAGLNPILISGNEIGGQLTLSAEIENYPGYNNNNSAELMEIMKNQALLFGTQIIEDTITEIDFKKKPFVCISANNNIFYADSIIIATGASAKWLDIKSEKQYRGFGVSVCATCDGFFYRNKDVIVVGGGNSAAEEAIYLTNFARSVTLIHRRDTLRADKILQDKLFNHPKINFKLDCVIEEIIGQENPKSVTAVKLKNLKSDKTETFKTDGIFVAIGHQPTTAIFQNHLDLDSKGYIKTKPDSCATSINGIFAAGDVKSSHFRQAIIAASSGAQAAIEASRFLHK